MTALRLAVFAGGPDDRPSGLREVLDAGPVDVVVGRFLEPGLLPGLQAARAADPDPAALAGCVAAAVGRLLPLLPLLWERGTRVVVDAGGVAPASLARAVRLLAADLGLDVPVAHVAGDDLLERVLDLAAAGEVELGPHTGSRALCASARLGGWGVARALRAGAQVVVTGRVVPACLVGGAVAAHFGWAPGDADREAQDRLAGAVALGHALERGTAATGGGYSFVREEVARPVRPGFPLAEVQADGSAVVTLPPGPGAVTVGTVTSALLDGLTGARYETPDVVADLSTLLLEQVGPDRVRMSGVRGAPPSGRLEVDLAVAGGYRNTAELLLTGLDVEHAAELTRAGLRDAYRRPFRTTLLRLDRPDAPSPEQATAVLRFEVRDAEPGPVGATFVAAVTGLVPAGPPGLSLAARPGEPQPYELLLPATVAARAVEHVVVHPDGRVEPVPHPAPGQPVAVRRPSRTTRRDGWVAPLGDEPVERVPLGRLAGARSAGRGTGVSIGLWTRTDPAADWLLGWLTEERVRELLPAAEGLRVALHPLAGLRAVVVVVPDLLDDTLRPVGRADPRVLGEHLRSRLVDVPVRLLR